MRVSVRRAAEAAVDSVGKTHSGSERCRRNVVHSDRWIGWRGSGVLFWRRENRAATLTSFQARLVKQIASPLLLRVIGVFYFEPTGTRLVGIGQALRDNALEVVRLHQLEQLASPALNRERLRDDRGSIRNDALQAPPALAER